MTQIDQAEIKAKLMAMKSETTTNSFDGASIRNASRSIRGQILKNQRAAGQLFESFLTKIGFETEKFEKIRAQNLAELRGISEKQHKDAITESVPANQVLRNSTLARLKTIEQLGTTIPSPYYILLKTPIFIIPSHDFILDSSQVAPLDSWGKFKIASETTGTDVLSFYFLWTNPSDKYAVINVDGFLIFNGNWNAGQNGGLFAGDSYGDLEITANLRLYEWWNQPPTQPTVQPDQTIEVLNVSNDQDSWDNLGEVDAGAVFRGHDLKYGLFVMPPQGSVVIEVAATIQYWCQNGGISVDFESGDFEIACPFVSIAILS